MAETSAMWRNDRDLAQAGFGQQADEKDRLRKLRGRVAGAENIERGLRLELGVSSRPVKRTAARSMNRCPASVTTRRRRIARSPLAPEARPRREAFARTLARDGQAIQGSSSMKCQRCSKRVGICI